MKRFGILAAGLLSASIVAGCGGGGIEEGPPKEGSLDPATPDMKEFMKQNAANMQPKPSQKKNAPKEATPTPEATKEK